MAGFVDMYRAKGLMLKKAEHRRGKIVDGKTLAGLLAALESNLERSQSSVRSTRTKYKEGGHALRDPPRFAAY